MSALSYVPSEAAIAREMADAGVDRIPAINRIRARRVLDLRDSRRALADVRRYVAANKAAIDAEWNALPNHPRTIEQHQAHVLTLRGRDHG